MHLDTVAEISCGYLMKTISSNSNTFLRKSWFENFGNPKEKCLHWCIFLLELEDQGHNPTETPRMFKNSLFHKYP